MVHIGRVYGGLGLVIGAGAVLIVVGVIVVLVVSAGLYGAVALSKIMLGIVSVSRQCIMALTVHAVL